MHKRKAVKQHSASASSYSPSSWFCSINCGGVLDQPNSSCSTSRSFGVPFSPTPLPHPLISSGSDPPHPPPRICFPLLPLAAMIASLQSSRVLTAALWIRWTRLRVSNTYLHPSLLLWPLLQLHHPPWWNRSLMHPPLTPQLQAQPFGILWQSKIFIRSGRHAGFSSLRILYSRQLKSKGFQCKMHD